MIIKQTPVERRLWASGATGTDKSEGKLVKASADGNTMSLLASASDIPDGVVMTGATEPTATAAIWSA